MKRPIKAAPAPTDEERKRERRFTKRLMALAVAGGLFGACINIMTRTMGKPPMPRPAGAAPPPKLDPPGK